MHPNFHKLKTQCIEMIITEGILWIQVGKKLLGLWLVLFVTAVLSSDFLAYGRISFDLPTPVGLISKETISYYFLAKYFDQSNKSLFEMKLGFVCYQILIPKTLCQQVLILLFMF